MSQGGGTVDVSESLLVVKGLTTVVQSAGRSVRVVDDVSFTIDRGQTIGFVGESGSGKTLTGLSIARLLPPRVDAVAGRVVFGGLDLLQAPESSMRRIRGARIGMVFQDPMSSLNPVLTVGYQVAEPARVHLGLSARSAHDRAIELLSQVGIARARERARDFPHQFSGGMRQRVMLAMALVCDPELLIADEPTTALDVTIQAQILELIASLSRDLGTAVLLITHDLGVAASMCDQVNVMYAGQIVERATTDAIFDDPRMPYTSGLIASIPSLHRGARGKLATIDGAPPDPAVPAAGCRFAARCRYMRDPCLNVIPGLTERGPNHLARCHGTEEQGWIQ